MNYNILLFCNIFIFFSYMFIFKYGRKEVESKNFRNKYAIKNRWVRKLIILKPKDDEPIVLYEFLPYILSAIHLLTLLPVHIIYWVSDNEFLGAILNGIPYKIYTLVFALFMFFVVCFPSYVAKKKWEKEMQEEQKKEDNQRNDS